MRYTMLTAVIASPHSAQPPRGVGARSPRCPPGAPPRRPALFSAASRLCSFFHRAAGTLVRSSKVAGAAEAMSGAGAKRPPPEQVRARVQAGLPPGGWAGKLAAGRGLGVATGRANAQPADSEPLCALEAGGGGPAHRQGAQTDGLREPRQRRRRAARRLPPRLAPPAQPVPSEAAQVFTPPHPLKPCLSCSLHHPAPPAPPRHVRTAPAPHHRGAACRAGADADGGPVSAESAAQRWSPPRAALLQPCRPGPPMCLPGCAARVAAWPARPGSIAHLPTNRALSSCPCPRLCAASTACARRCALCRRRCALRRRRSRAPPTPAAARAPTTAGP